MLTSIACAELIRRKSVELCAIRMFNQQQDFVQAVEEQVLPQLVRLHTPQGIGTGFFQHTDWLVSNAHVIPDVNNLRKTTIIDFRGQSRPLEAQLAFHRPFSKDNAPDIVIAKTASRNSSMAKSLPVFFNHDLSTGKTLTFCIYFDPLKAEPTPVFLFLGENPISKPSTYPMIYCSKDDSEPSFGCSGAPVLQARVAIAGRNPVWQFRVLGAVYARCAPQWYASYVNRQAIFSGESNLLCAIPVLSDFEQIRRDILIKKDQINRSIDIINSCSNSPQLSDVVRREQLNLGRLLEEINQNIALFRDGVTQLKIDLPQGLEKLVYSDKQLLEMTKNQAQSLSRAERERREQLLRAEQKQKEEQLEKLKASVTPTSKPFTDKFGADHVSDQSKESLRASQKRISGSRSYGAENGEKTSSVMRISEEEGRKEVKKIAESLTIDDLTRTSKGEFQIKKGVIHTTDESYPTSSAGLYFSRPGRRKQVDVDKESSRMIQKAKIAPKIEDGQLKIHHYHGQG